MFINLDIWFCYIHKFHKIMEFDFFFFFLLQLEQKMMFHFSETEQSLQMIMDTFGVLALATKPPNDELMKDHLLHWATTLSPELCASSKTGQIAWCASKWSSSTFRQVYLHDVHQIGVPKDQIVCCLTEMSICFLFIPLF